MELDGLLGLGQSPFFEWAFHLNLKAGIESICETIYQWMPADTGFPSICRPLGGTTRLLTLAAIGHNDVVGQILVAAWSDRCSTSD